MTDRTQTAYDEWAATYDTSPNPQTLLEYDDVLALLNVQRGERILDAACGTGRYTAALLERGANVIGMDISEGMLAVARRRLPLADFRRGDLTRTLEFPAADFDAIVCGQALKHLRSLVPTVAEFARVLKPGGRLVFSVTHPAMTWDDYEMSQDPGFLLAENADIFHHTVADYVDAVRAAGMHVECTASIGVSERIRHLLTARSYARVVGRAQVMVMRVRRPSVPLEAG